MSLNPFQPAEGRDTGCVMLLSLLLTACGGLNGTTTDEVGDTGIDVVVVHRGGDASDGSSGGTSGDTTDSAQSTITCFWDEDLDGHGNGGVYEDFEADECPEGYAEVGDDFCEDNANAYTEADCAAQVDEDGDGYAVEDDCNDTDGTVNPGATEVEADGIDNDCDGIMAGEPAEEITCCNGGDLSDCMMTTDDECPSGYVEVDYGMTCCVDTDNDGYGGADECMVTAADECPDGSVEGNGDCNNVNSTVSPDEDDPYGNGRDEDCDGYDG